MEPEKATKTEMKIKQRIIICIVILLFGALGMVALSHLKKPPEQVKLKERALQVRTLVAKATDVPVMITGYGEARVLDVVAISPEVSGRIVATHPDLEPGEVVAKGALLFEVDPRNYLTAYQEAVASVRQWEHTISRLRETWAIDEKRLKTMVRNRDIAEGEYGRVQKLFEQGKVGTRSGVEAAEQAYNTAEDRVAQIEQAIALYPIQIKEAQSTLAMARSRQDLAKTNLARCKVRAPFDGRIKEANLERGQFVSPGQTAVVLADDSVLEIQVPLDSRDARAWLQFNDEALRTGAFWFTGLKPVICRIAWTEASAEQFWEGRLHRVVRFDKETRTLTAAVRISDANTAVEKTGTLPLVEGMFCRVEIPGRTMEKVIRLPRWAVSFENTVYVVNNGRLKTVPVTVARLQGDDAFIADGIKPGDQVIVTRLVNPMEHVLLVVKDSERQEVQP